MRAMFVSLVVLVAASCHSGDSGAHDSANNEPATASVAPAETKSVQITPEMIDRYAGFVKDRSAAVKVAAAHMNDRMKKTSERLDGKTGDAAAVAETQELLSGFDNEGKKLDDTDSQLREKWKISKEEQKVLARLVKEVTRTRIPWRVGGGEKGLAKLEQQREKMNSMLQEIPRKVRPEQAAKAKAMIGDQLKRADELLERMRQARDLTDLRAKHGGPLVDRVLANEQDFTKSRFGL